ERFESSSMVEDGAVCLLALDAVRARLGARWEARRQQVYDHAEQTLRRNLGPHAFVLRVADTDFVVAQPGVERLAGQAFCLNCLREVLTYFLGEALLADIVVHQVDAIAGGRIESRKLDAATLEAQSAPLLAAAREIEAPPLPSPAVPSLSIPSPDRWSPFFAKDGRKLRVSCQLEPVFALKTYGRIGYRLRRKVLILPSELELSRAEQQRLAGPDIERIDFATLARGLNRLADGGAGLQPSLVLPVSFVTLASTRGRARLVELFRAAQASVQRGLICEVCDIEGVPPSALLAATALIRPFCLLIIGHLAAPPLGSLADFKDTGLNGLSITRPAAVEADEAFDGFVKAMVAIARPVAKSLMIYGVSGANQAAIASQYGVTHASFAPKSVA
ncbi:MAG TPA: hypothetical protein VFE13_01950, partial [Caulobacteraceae bacterium]|nr:hypothetical protein [Caulobacteraceae bacterium]